VTKNFLETGISESEPNGKEEAENKLHYRKKIFLDVRTMIESYFARVKPGRGLPPPVDGDNGAARVSKRAASKSSGPAKQLEETNTKKTKKKSVRKTKVAPKSGSTRSLVHPRSNAKTPQHASRSHQSGTTRRFGAVGQGGGGGGGANFGGGGGKRMARKVQKGDGGDESFGGEGGGDGSSGSGGGSEGGEFSLFRRDSAAPESLRQKMVILPATLRTLIDPSQNLRFQGVHCTFECVAQLVAVRSESYQTLVTFDDSTAVTQMTLDPSLVNALETIPLENKPVSTPCVSSSSSFSFSSSDLRPKRQRPKDDLAKSHQKRPKTEPRPHKEDDRKEDDRKEDEAATDGDNYPNGSNVNTSVSRSPDEKRTCDSNSSSSSPDNVKKSFATTTKSIPSISASASMSHTLKSGQRKNVTVVSRQGKGGSGEGDDNNCVAKTPDTRKIVKTENINETPVSFGNTNVCGIGNTNVFHSSSNTNVFHSSSNTNVFHSSSNTNVFHSSSSSSSEQQSFFALRQYYVVHGTFMPRTAALAVKTMRRVTDSNQIAHSALHALKAHLLWLRSPEYSSNRVLSTATVLEHKTPLASFEPLRTHRRDRPKPDPSSITDNGNLVSSSSSTLLTSPIPYAASIP
jgi:hypothetical protein